ncbi:hypothetical protein SAY86_022118 [Trapa natans]|uniref:Pentatricopeptide repeat-containing protein n=1 Tax=Trapa natans TaxID=22666 RepID=A0AAN7RKT9_TRANT|nr:hypothetical protein SAY86_022118 [Trapa natans]
MPPLRPSGHSCSPVLPPRPHHSKKPYAAPPSSKSMLLKPPYQGPGGPPNPSRPGFASYLKIPNLSPKIKLLCEVIATTHALSVERVLDDSISGLRVTQEDVEEVLKLSYGFPSTAVKFYGCWMYCYENEFDSATRLLDEMICNGAFPDEETYNVLFKFLIRGRKLGDASAIFTEMIKNECLPSLANCQAAVRMSIDSSDSAMALKVWGWMAENYVEELEETANLLVVGLRDMNQLPEAVKYAEDIVERKIKLNSSTLSKLKQSLSKAKKDRVCNEILQKWKFH